MQLAALVYARCVKAYPDRLVNMMPTFMFSFKNEVNTISTRMSRRRQHEVATSVLLNSHDSEEFTDPFGEDQSFDDVEFQILMEDNPDIARLWKLFVESKIKPRRKRSVDPKKDQSKNQFFCSLLSLDPKRADALAGIRQFLNGEICETC